MNKKCLPIEIYYYTRFLRVPKIFEDCIWFTFLQRLKQFSIKSVVSSGTPLPVGIPLKIVQDLLDLQLKTVRYNGIPEKKSGIPVYLGKILKPFIPLLAV